MNLTDSDEPKFGFSVVNRDHRCLRWNHNSNLFQLSGNPRTLKRGVG